MKKSNLKKILALLFCLVMVFSLAACSDGSTDSTADTTDENGTDSSLESADTADSGTDSDADADLTSKEFITQSGANMDTQVDNVVIAMTSTSVNVGPFAPSSPGSVGKYELYGSSFISHTMELLLRTVFPGWPAGMSKSTTSPIRSPFMITFTTVRATI